MKQNKTMQDIADQAGVSKQTVFRCIRDNNIKETGKEGNAFVYAPDTADKILELLGVIDNTKTEDNSQEELEAEIKRLRESQEELHEAFAKEREAIRADYREQLYSKDKQINDLHRLLDQQQQLSLVNHSKIETLELELKEKEEVKKEQKEQENSKRWSIFNIFRK